MGLSVNLFEGGLRRSLSSLNGVRGDRDQYGASTNEKGFLLGFILLLSAHKDSIIQTEN